MNKKTKRNIIEHYFLKTIYNDFDNKKENNKMKKYNEKFIEWLEDYCIYVDDCDEKVIDCILGEYEEDEKENIEGFFDYLIDNALDIDDMHLKEYTFIREAYLNDEDKLTFFINNTEDIHYLTDEFIKKYDDYEKLESYDVIYDEFTGVGYYIES